MRILLVSQYYEPAWDYGGPAAKVTAIARHLARRGHNVDVLTSSVSPAAQNSPVAQNFSSASVAGSSLGDDLGVPGTRDIGGVRVHYLRSVLRYRGVSINPGVSSFCRRHLDRFDLVHIFGVYDWLGTMTYRAVRERRIPYVVEPLGMYLPMERGFIRKWMYRRFVGGRFLRAAARVIATSDAEYEQLRSIGVTRNGNVTIRPNGIELQAPARPDAALRRDIRRRLGIGEADRIVLFLGRMAPIKHLELLLEAFAGLDLPDVHLVLAGPRPDPEYARSLEHAAARLDAVVRIHFHEAVHGAEKAALMNDAHLVVLSSRSESFGNVVAEAVASDVPVVVTEGCGVAALVRDRVGLVSEHSVEKFREALRQALEDRTLFATFKANCARVKQEFSWDGPIDMLEKMYQEILAEREGSRLRAQGSGEALA